MKFAVIVAALVLGATFIGVYFAAKIRAYLKAKRAAAVAEALSLKIAATVAAKNAIEKL